MRAAVLVVLLALACAGCVLDDLDYTNRPCPCAEGWTCDEARDVCVRGAASDGGPFDGGGMDVPRTDAGDLCATGDYLFCDGFEDGELYLTSGPWQIVVPSMGTGFGPTMDRARTGSWSFAARTTSAGQQAAVVSQQLGGVASGELWARTWVYVPSGQMIDGLIPLSVGNGITGWVHALVGPGSQLTLVVGSNTGGAVPEAYPATMTYPTDAWFCLRLRVAISDAGSAQLYLGDTAIAMSTSGIDTLPAGDYESVIAGIGYSLPAQQPVEIYVDDVAVHTSTLGCD